jgi:hypothetical protein
MGYKNQERSGRVKDERYEQFEKDCQSLIGNVTDALFVAWGKGILRGRQEEREAHTLELRSREESYQKGYADGMKEAIRTAERMVEE